MGINAIDAVNALTKEGMLGKVKMRLVAKGAENENALLGKDFLDLRVIYTVDLGDNMTAKLTPGWLERFGVTFEDLDRAAYANTVAEKYAIATIEGVLGREDMGFPFPRLFVVSNREMLFGAAALIEKKTIVDFVRSAGENAFILPSSVHEVLIYFDRGDSVDELKSMVYGINRSEVAVCDRLSDSVYYVDRESGEITIAG